MPDTPDQRGTNERGAQRISDVRDADDMEPQHRHCREPRAAIELLQEMRGGVEDPEMLDRIDERIDGLRRECDDGGQEPPPPPPPILRISGIEATQATQFFRSELNPCPDRSGSGPCPDNDIPLVGRKTTVLRVYPHYPTRDPPPIVTSISGELRIRQDGDEWSDPIKPFNGPISPRREQSIDRGNPDHTLNFRLPPRSTQGTLQTRVTIFDANSPHQLPRSRPRRRTLEFAPFSELKIRLVRIRYQNDTRNDGPFDVDAPTIGEYLRTARFTHKTYPVSQMRIVKDSVELYDGDFTSFFASAGPEARGTTGTIFEILTDLLETENLGSDVQYFACIPGPPANQAGRGHAVSRRNIGEVGHGPTMAHELGHNCIGSDHAPCGNPHSPDPDYPDYGDGSYPAASIGEFGFDTWDGTVHDPTNTHDLMSYCSPNWISPYMYERLFRCFGPGARAAGDDAPEIRRGPRERFYLAVAIDRADRVIWTGHGIQLPGRPLVQTGIRSPYVAELQSESGDIIESQRLRHTDSHQGLDASRLECLVDVPWNDDASEIVFKREGEVLDAFDIAADPPAVEIEAVGSAGETLADEQTISWSYPDGEEPTLDEAEATQHLRYSTDGGTTWSTIARNVRGTEYRIDPDELPGGEECVFQVIVTEGFRTGVATSERFRVPRKPRMPLIVSPEHGTRFENREPIQFVGLSHSPAGEGDERSLQWSSSIDGFLGSGGILVSHTLSAGTHRIRLDTEDSLDDDVSANVTITVEGAP